jgi:hypothetical protein
MNRNILTFIFIFSSIFIMTNKAKACIDEKPVAYISSYDETETSGHTVHFYGELSYDPDNDPFEYGFGITQWYWEIYDGYGNCIDEITGSTPSYIFSTPGYYYIYLIVVDDEYNSSLWYDEITQQWYGNGNWYCSVYITAVPHPEIDFNQTTVAVGGSLGFYGGYSHDEDEGGYSIVGYYWYKRVQGTSDWGSVLGTSSSINISFSQAGTFQIKLEVLDDDGETASEGLIIYVASVTNYRETYREERANGELYFEYSWDSTTGNLAHLSGCYVGEKVDYQGGNPFNYPSPPFSGSTPNPTISEIDATYGILRDSHYVPSFLKPYQAATYTATQNYRFKDYAGTYTTLMGPISIVRSVTGGGPWKYSITKSGAYAQIFPMP